MSILHAINYYDGLEEGELTPAPSDEECDVSDILQQKASGTVYDHKHHLAHEHLRSSEPDNRRESRIRESSLVEKTRRESEQRLRTLVIRSFMNRIQDSNSQHAE
jgi:hypothetical protein